MRKVVKISGKEYSMKSSAYTQFKYKDVTGRKMLDDIQKISNINKMNEEEQIGQMEDVIQLLLQIAYIMIDEADDKQVKSYEDFLKGIDKVFETSLEEAETFTELKSGDNIIITGGFNTNNLKAKVVPTNLMKIETII